MQHVALVTGGTGFLGQHLVRALQHRGWHVRVLVRPGRDGRSVTAAGGEIVRGDVLDRHSLRTAVDGIAVAFHLAGRLQQPGVPAEEYERLHVEGTANLMRACRDAATVKAIVHCSTTGVLGPTSLEPAGEETPGQPSTAYERSKAQGERIACALAERHALPLTIARPSLVYGPGDLHLLGWFRAIQHGYYRVVGRGDNIIHPVFVADVIDGLLRCARAAADRVRTYNLVGPEPLPIRDFAAAIARALGRRLPHWHLPRPMAYGVARLLEALPVAPARLPLTRGRVAFMTETRIYSGARADADLAYVAHTGVEAGLRAAVAWYRHEGLL